MRKGLLGCVWVLLIVGSSVRAQTVLVSAMPGVAVDSRTSTRIEKNLQRSFPWKQMRSAARNWSAPPSIRQAEYAVIEDGNAKYLVTAFTAFWNDEPYNQLSVYRLLWGWPQLVWRSRAWRAAYSGFNVESSRRDSRTVILFTEGLSAADYSMSCLFSLHRSGKISWLRAVTPVLPYLSAKTPFAFEPLLAAGPMLTPEGMLTAHDGDVRSAWQYDGKRDKFTPTLTQRAQREIEQTVLH